MRTAVKRIEESGFTLVEVVIASVIMVILCVGTLTVFSYAVRVNRGNNLRAQAMSILQKEVEYYRSLKFVPVGSSAELNAGTFTNLRTRTSPDGRVFNISVTIDNDPLTTGVQTTPLDADCKFKEITITVVPQVAETSWLANLKTDVTIQRVRAN
jgi:prepilin-type N-terminal cleavage/methylation domain-containing protein